MKLPPPDPNEYHEPSELDLRSPTAVFLGGPPSAAADRLAARLLDWRPGALLIVRR
ncbi:MAG TPA: hypothetical protein VFM58_06300 [Solirubrobacteraceae bacterium]|jgi:hypothetical protein|nr:hypothetical protein [Solirubrobacteraceae bacterium]